MAPVEKKSPGLLDSISQENGLAKEELVRKELAISHGKECGSSWTRCSRGYESVLPFVAPSRGGKP